MHVVIATAEPLGAYHLTALSTAMDRNPATFTHLIPYPQPTQGTSAATPVADLDVLLRADRLVLSGGGFTPWTYAVALHARSVGIPVFLCELAYGTTDPYPLSVDRLAALSTATAVDLARNNASDLGDVVITGNPQLDNLPDRSDNPTHVLLVSTSELDQRDPDGVLRRIGNQLLDEGRSVVVSLHPREDPRYWNGFATDSSAIAAAYSTAALAYPGSVWPVLACIGTPIVGVGPHAMRRAIPRAFTQLAGSWLTPGQPFDCAILHRAAPPPLEALSAVTGPRGGSAERIVQFMTAM